MAGLMVIPGGWPSDLAEHFENEAAAEAALADQRNRRELCTAFGHIEHTCPACGDRSCLRCKVGLDD